MRSLWKIIAVRWLGGEASDALTGDAILLDLLMTGSGSAPSTFLVRRQSEVSHQAMMSQQDRAPSEHETTLEHVVRTDPDA